MKNLLIISCLCLLNINAISQKITISNSSKKYEYSHVKEFEGNVGDRLTLFEKKMNELNYSNVNSSDNQIKGESFITKVLTGTAMEVHYNLVIQLKEGRYRLAVNDFTIKDQRFGTYILEDLKERSQKRWVSFINEKLPDIIKNVESKVDEDW